MMPQAPPLVMGGWETELLALVSPYAAALPPDALGLWRSLTFASGERVNDRFSSFLSNRLAQGADGRWEIDDLCSGALTRDSVESNALLAFVRDEFIRKNRIGKRRGPRPATGAQCEEFKRIVDIAFNALPRRMQRRAVQEALDVIERVDIKVRVLEQPVAPVPQKRVKRDARPMLPGLSGTRFAHGTRADLFWSNTRRANVAVDSDGFYTLKNGWTRLLDHWLLYANFVDFVEIQYGAHCRVRSFAGETPHRLSTEEEDRMLMELSRAPRLDGRPCELPPVQMPPFLHGMTAAVAACPPPYFCLHPQAPSLRANAPHGSFALAVERPLSVEGGHMLLPAAHAPAQLPASLPHRISSQPLGLPQQVNRQR